MVKENGGRLFLNLIFSVYNSLLDVFGSKIISFLSCKSLNDPEFRRGRLGIYEGLSIPSGYPRIWFHAVSVGEATGAVPTLLALKRKIPRAGIFLTSGTPQGMLYAKAHLPADVPVVPFPLDFPACVSRALNTLRPGLFICFETEFWPNFYRELERTNTPALLLNGRVSESSERLYRLFSPLFRPVFKQFTRMAMHSSEDEKRAIRIGAPPEKIQVLGSSKYETLIEKAQPERAEFWKKLLRLKEGTPVLIGGSLRGIECIELMRIFGKLHAFSPNLVGIFAPRHMVNISRMRDWLAGEGIAYDLLSEIESGVCGRRSPVVLVDRIGVLFDLYSAGDLIFCGGTFEPIGGHNILEPAAWSKAVFYGPHLKKILHEHRILRKFGGSFPVLDPGDLLIQWKSRLGNLESLIMHGQGAKSALHSLGGVVESQVKLILELLPQKDDLIAAADSFMIQSGKQHVEHTGSTARSGKDGNGISGYH
ncbi:MAG: 3-deoxy-D-manno-octulosonic acid transferase [Syntrophobacteraceae bacterium]